MNRRGFLKLLGAAPVAVAAAKLGVEPADDPVAESLALQGSVLTASGQEVWEEQGFFNSYLGSAPMLVRSVELREVTGVGDQYRRYEAGPVTIRWEEV